MEALVIGSTGKTGRRAVEALLARVVDVQATGCILTSPGDALTPVVSDWADGVTRAGIAGDAEAIYMVGPGRLERPALPVARLLAGLPGVSRVFALSDIEAATLNADTWPNRDIEQPMQRSGKEWTVVRCNWLHQNFNEAPLFTANIDAHDETVARLWEGQVSLIDGTDVTKVAAGTMTTDGDASQTYPLTGPLALTFAEVAAALTDAGRPVRHGDLTAEEMAERLARDGLPAPAVELLDLLFEQVRGGHNSEVTDSVERLIGRLARSLAASSAADLQEEA